MIAVVTSVASLTLVICNIKSKHSSNIIQGYEKNEMAMITTPLLEKLIKDHLLTNIRSSNEHQIGNCPPVAVHKKLNFPNNLSANYSNGPVFSQTDHFVTTFNTELNNKQVLVGAEVVQNGIRIQYSGLYYMYSGLQFTSNVTWGPLKLSDRSWFHYVHRISPNSPMNSGVLLRTVHTVYPECNSSQENIYTGGIFHLNRGDIIKVCLSGLRIADFSDESSYFGMFMLHGESGKP